VFTEQQYFDFFDRPNTLFNYTFLYLLREYSCVFVGMSMTDVNVRRLIHYCKSDVLRGYLEENTATADAEEKSTRHFALLPKSDSPRLDEAITHGLERLGTG